MSQDSIFFDSSSGGSRLLSESAFLPSGSSISSYTGPGGNDLSISELSLSDKPETAEEDDNDARLRDPEELERIKKHTSKLRDEKLQNDAFVLKKLNAALSSFNDALGDVGSQSERIAAQLAQTEELLNKYVGILSGSEEFARLIFDDEWQGAEADEITMAQEQREAEERARRLEEERVATARREQERLQREELERADQKDRERAEREKNERAAARGGVRGVRGTRASMRAAARGAGASRGGKYCLVKRIGRRLIIGVVVPSSGRPPATTSVTRGSSTTRGVGRRS
ncbi:Sphingosine-1-phosphate phosphatase [Mycena venus]|uniref:DASH complex subunit DUO1 n=1 Tax=Mycena venus TaxID=2733690 RepID=A0A8H6YIJ3_9AGAR|nr:Sphingosine-1-phosphate phosphatase [Mycena venus]